MSLNFSCKRPLEQGEECKAGMIMDPFIDWGFKRLFGSEEHKDNLICFLNVLLKPEPKIERITYVNTEFIPSFTRFSASCRFIVFNSPVKQNDFPLNLPATEV